MPTQPHNCYAATCGGLNSAILDATSRIRVSTNNAKLKADCEQQVATFTKSMQICDVVLDIIKPMYNDVKTYLNKKRAESMQSVNNALRLAEYVVPDSEPGVHFELDGDKAILLTEDGLTVGGTEGDGFHEVSSVFLRSVIAGYNPSILSTLVLDEVFAHLSVENSANLSSYLEIISQDTQIISIEQKSQVYSNIDYVQYRFDKTDGFAEVTKEIVKRGEANGDTSIKGTA